MMQKEKGSGRVKRFFFIIVAAAVFLTGCGGSPAGAGQGAGEPVTEPAEPADGAEPEGKEISEDGVTPDGSAGAGMDGAEGAGMETAESPVAEGKFYLYSWDGELEERLEYVYAHNPGLRDRIEYINVGDPALYRERIGQLLGTPEAEEYPDMIALDADGMAEYKEGGLLVPVTDCGITDVDVMEMYPYTITMATDQRECLLRGVTWQGCPGGFLYRADLAASILDVKSPEEMQVKIGSWDDFLETAGEIKEKSDDATRMLSSGGGVGRVFLSNRNRPWVASDGVFHMDDRMLEYIDVMDVLADGELMWDATVRPEEGQAGFRDDSVFGYFGDLWFLQEMEAYCGGEAAGGGTYGLWNVCRGPAPCYGDGTWLGATAGCSDTVLAGQIMKALCCDTGIMTEISRGTQDFVNNKSAMRALSDAGEGIRGFLGGQDLVAALLPVAKEADVSWRCAYDREIDALLDEQVAACMAGEKDRDGAVADFREAVAAAFPSVTVE